jgi:hypothetical protein
MRSLAALAIAAGIGGCGGDGATTSGCPAFTSIVAGDFARMSGNLVWTMQVAKMPDAFTFNQMTTPDNMTEYEWAVDVDADQDGRRDLSVALMHFRFPGSQPMTVRASNLVFAAQQNLWSFESASRETVIGPATASLDGDTLRFEVQESEDARLAQVTTRDQSTWRTRYQFGPGQADFCGDALPPSTAP